MLNSGGMPMPDGRNLLAQIVKLLGGLFDGGQKFSGFLVEQLAFGGQSQMIFGTDEKDLQKIPSPVP